MTRSPDHPMALIVSFLTVTRSTTSSRSRYSPGVNESLAADLHFGLNDVFLPVTL